MPLPLFAYPVRLGVHPVSGKTSIPLNQCALCCYHLDVQVGTALQESSHFVIHLKPGLNG
jgi:hypothetical protein